METGVTRPNVLWIFGDQHRGQALGWASDPNLHTPHLDRLATEGVIFRAAVTPAPLCSPARGSLLTGRYPHHCVPGHEDPLPNGQPTIATALRSAGYTTAYFGKWHVGGFSERDRRAALAIIPPARRGDFDEWVGYENNNSQWDSWVHGGEGETAFHKRLPGYETDALTDRLLDMLRRYAAAPPDARPPFFAVLSVQPPHDPYVAPAAWMARHTPGRVVRRPNVPPLPRVVEQASRELAGYYAMIENLDWNVGRVRQVLDELGLADTTHIVFFSDHGDMHGSHGQFRKTTPWEEAIRVPMILGGHGSQYANLGGPSTIPISLVDLAPTTLGLCGIDPPAWMEGTDLSGRRVPFRTLRHEPDSAYVQIAVPTGHLDSVDRPWRAVVTRDGWKYAVLPGQPWLMFNLNEDPYEQVNLAHNTRYAQERRRLHDRLRQWIHDTGDTFAAPEV